MDNEVPKQLNLSSNGITNESGTGGQYALFGFSCPLVSRRSRVLDTCSLTIRTIHIWETLWDPPEPELDSFLFLGATN